MMTTGNSNKVYYEHDEENQFVREVLKHVAVDSFRALAFGYKAE